MWAQRPHGVHTQGRQALLLPLGLPLGLLGHWVPRAPGSSLLRACPAPVSGPRTPFPLLKGASSLAPSEPPGQPSRSAPRRPLGAERSAGPSWGPCGGPRVCGGGGRGDGCWDMAGEGAWASGSWTGGQGSSLDLGGGTGRPSEAAARRCQPALPPPRATLRPASTAGHGGRHEPGGVYELLPRRCQVSPPPLPPPLSTPPRPPQAVPGRGAAAPPSPAPPRSGSLGRSDSAAKMSAKDLFGE